MLFRISSEFKRDNLNCVVFNHWDWIRLFVKSLCSKELQNKKMCDKKDLTTGSQFVGFLAQIGFQKLGTSVAVTAAFNATFLSITVFFVLF